MRKKILLILIIIFSLSLVGCKKGNNITLNIPIDFFDEDLIGTEDLQDGVESIERVDDEVVIVMKEKHYRYLMKELKLVLEEEFDDLLNDEDCSYVKKVEYDEEFINIKVYVDEKEYEEYLDWTPMLISLLGETYQVYGGVESNMNIDYINVVTGRVITSLNYPEN